MQLVLWHPENPEHQSTAAERYKGQGNGGPGIHRTASMTIRKSLYFGTALIASLGAASLADDADGTAKLLKDLDRAALSVAHEVLGAEEEQQDQRDWLKETVRQLSVEQLAEAVEGHVENEKTDEAVVILKALLSLSGDSDVKDKLVDLPLVSTLFQKDLDPESRSYAALRVATAEYVKNVLWAPCDAANELLHSGRSEDDDGVVAVMLYDKHGVDALRLLQACRLINPGAARFMQSARGALEELVENSSDPEFKKSLSEKIDEVRQSMNQEPTPKADWILSELSVGRACVGKFGVNSSDMIKEQCGNLAKLLHKKRLDELDGFTLTNKNAVMPNSPFPRAWLANVYYSDKDALREAVYVASASPSQLDSIAKLILEERCDTSGISAIYATLKTRISDPLVTNKAWFRQPPAPVDNMLHEFFDALGDDRRKQKAQQMVAKGAVHPSHIVTAALKLCGDEKAGKYAGIFLGRIVDVAPTPEDEKYQDFLDEAEGDVDVVLQGHEGLSYECETALTQFIDRLAKKRENVDEEEGAAESESSYSDSGSEHEYDSSSESKSGSGPESDLEFEPEPGVDGQPVAPRAGDQDLQGDRPGTAASINPMSEKATKKMAQADEAASAKSDSDEAYEKYKEDIASIISAKGAEKSTLASGLINQERSHTRNLMLVRALVDTCQKDSKSAGTVIQLLEKNDAKASCRSLYDFVDKYVYPDDYASCPPMKDFMKRWKPGVWSSLLSFGWR